MFLSIFKMMLNAERCSVLPSSTVLPVEKKKKFPDSFFGGLGEYYIQKWLKNSKKNSLVLGGLNSVPVCIKFCRIRARAFI
jgi:hypothetical protein